MKERSWTCLLRQVDERKWSPGFTATKLLEILYNMARRASTLICSKVLQLGSLSISVTLSNPIWWPVAAPFLNCRNHCFPRLYEGLKQYYSIPTGGAVLMRMP